MKIRSARTLVFSRQDGGMVGFNFLTRSVFACSPDLLTFLGLIDDWTEIPDLHAHLPALSAEGLAATVDSLVAVNAVTAAGSEQAAREESYDRTWKWGTPAAMFHFSLLDKERMPLPEAEAMQLARLRVTPQPALYERNDPKAGWSLPLPPALEGNDLLQLMARRRTVRTVEPRGVTLRQLSDCLFAGLGITGETRNVAGVLPLAMTPSGGARNPYEAYVYARRVDGLEAGFYHYSAYDHSLARLTGNALPAPSELIGNPDWSDAMPCIVILLARFDRTWWKYDDANAYRVVLIEAGHIGQNIMLAATREGLTAVPTGALNHASIHRCLGMTDTIATSPVYALALAHPAQAH